MKKRSWFFVISLYALLLLTVFVFQSMIFPYIRIMGFVPLLLPIAATGVAVYSGCHAGGIAGLFAGMLCDVSFDQPVGVFMVLLTFTGLIIGAIFDSHIMRGFVTYLISCFVVLVISAVVQIIPHFSFRELPPVTIYSVAFTQTIISLFFAIPLWFFVRALAGRMHEVSTRERPL